MKKLLALLLLFSVSPAWAALTAGNCNGATISNTNPVTVGPLTSIASGQAIVVDVANWSGETITVSDGTNGSYTAANSSATGPAQGWWWVKTTATATPTVSITNPSADNLVVTVCEITGFTGTPTIDTGLEAAFSGSTATVSASPLTTGHATEMMLFGLTAIVSHTNWSSAPAGWTDQVGPDAQTILTAYEATSGTTNNVSGTLVTAQNWYGLSVGIYDATGGGSCTHAGITSAGASAIPNGTSGSYWGKTGGFVTPNCSSINYWQPAVGNFGTN
jgi:hypothetical protein